MASQLFCRHEIRHIDIDNKKLSLLELSLQDQRQKQRGEGGFEQLLWSQWVQQSKQKPTVLGCLRSEKTRQTGDFFFFQVLLVPSAGVMLVVTALLLLLLGFFFKSVSTSSSSLNEFFPYRSFHQARYWKGRAEGESQ